MFFLALFLAEIFILFLLSRSLQKEVAMFFYRITNSKKWTSYLLSIFFLPGTFIHEAAHFLTALFLFVPVGQMELLPEIQEGERVKMGSVPVGKADMVRRTLIGISPFVFGIGIILGLLAWLTANNLFENVWLTALTIYITFEIGNTMFLSKKDLEGAWKFLVLIFFAVVIIYLLGIRFDFLYSLIQSEKSIEVFRRASIFLFVPIAIDLIAIFLLRSTRS